MEFSDEREPGAIAIQGSAHGDRNESAVAGLIACEQPDQNIAALSHSFTFKHPGPRNWPSRDLVDAMQSVLGLRFEIISGPFYFCWGRVCLVWGHGNWLAKLAIICNNRRAREKKEGVARRLVSRHSLAGHHGKDVVVEADWQRDFHIFATQSWKRCF